MSKITSAEKSKENDEENEVEEFTDRLAKMMVSNEIILDSVMDKLSLIDLLKYQQNQVKKKNDIFLDRLLFSKFIARYFLNDDFMKKLKETKASITGSTIVQYVLNTQYINGDMDICFKNKDDLDVFGEYLVNKNNYIEDISYSENKMYDFTNENFVNTIYIYKKFTKENLIIELMVPVYQMRYHVIKFYSTHLRNYYDCENDNLFCYSLHSILYKKGKICIQYIQLSDIEIDHPDIIKDSKKIYNELVEICNDFLLHGTNSNLEIYSAKTQRFLLHYEEKYDGRRNAESLMRIFKGIEKYKTRGFLFEIEPYDEEKNMSLINISENFHVNENYYEHKTHKIKELLNMFNLDWKILGNANVEISGSYILSNIINEPFNNMDLDLYIQETVAISNVDIISMMLVKKGYSLINNAGYSYHKGYYHIICPEYKFNAILAIYPKCKVWGFSNGNHKIDLISYPSATLGDYLIDYYYADHIMNFYNIQSNKLYSISPIKKLQEKKMSLAKNIETSSFESYIKTFDEYFDKYPSSILSLLCKNLLAVYYIPENPENDRPKNTYPPYADYYNRNDVIPAHDYLYSHYENKVSSIQKNKMIEKVFESFLLVLYKFDILETIDLQRLPEIYIKYCVRHSLEEIYCLSSIDDKEKVIKEKKFYTHFMQMFKKYIAVKKYKERGFVLVE